MAIEIQNNLLYREQKIKSEASKYNAIITLHCSSPSWKPLKLCQ